LANQNIVFLKQQVENHFFELVKIARINSDSIAIKGRTGKKVFITLLREFDACYEIVKIVAENNNLKKINILNLAYLCFFFGVIGKKSKEILKEKYKGPILQDVFNSFKSEYPNYEKKLHYKPFHGHQIRLGHYYRHLFQTVKYINEQEILNYEEKYQYIKTLRAQLSTQEQVLLFLNSLSDLGSPWEIIYRKRGLINYIKCGNRKSNINNMLITKYNLIKNIPKGFVKGVKFRNYYPHIKYEGDFEPTKLRKKLIKIYHKQFSILSKVC